MLNCFDGYLVPECATCPDWADGSDPEKGLGCATCGPISECPYFAREEKKREQAARKCYKCGWYRQCSKTCGKTGQHVARKGVCQDFTWVHWEEV